MNCRMVISVVALIGIACSSLFGQDQAGATPAANQSKEAAAAPDDEAAGESTQSESNAEQQSADGPVTIDPTEVLPKILSRELTVEFEEEPLKDIAAQLQTLLGIPVLLDEVALADIGIPSGEPMTDQLTGEPVYLLLDRLGTSLELSWYFEDDIITITSEDAADDHQTTRPYEMTAFLDEGYDRDALVETLTECVSGDWQHMQGIGGVIEWLGDVLFVRANDQTHREIQALLLAIREHGLRTFVAEPVQHERLREVLSEPIDVDFDDTPLAWAIDTLAEKTGADIRLDVVALRDAGIRTREPVTLTLQDRDLETVLVVLLKRHNLTWTLQNGVLLVTTWDEASDMLKTAVFDVSDLCRDDAETVELINAIQSQLNEDWVNTTGIGGVIRTPKVGTMVVRHTERTLQLVSELLATYRQALKTSKRRSEEQDNPNEVLTRYYRLDESVARDLRQLIPMLVEPPSWNPAEPTNESPRILSAASGYTLIDASGVKLHSVNPKAEEALVVPQSVLIIRQTRAAHEEIAELIDRIQQGDPIHVPDEGFFGGTGGGIGGGGGGFGGSLLGTGK